MEEPTGAGSVLSIGGGRAGGLDSEQTRIDAEDELWSGTLPPHRHRRSSRS